MILCIWNSTSWTLITASVKYPSRRSWLHTHNFDMPLFYFIFLKFLQVNMCLFTSSESSNMGRHSKALHSNSFSLFITDFNRHSVVKGLFWLLFFLCYMVYGHLAPKPLHYCGIGHFVLPDVIFCVPCWSCPALQSLVSISIHSTFNFFFLNWLYMLIVKLKPDFFDQYFDNSSYLFFDLASYSITHSDKIYSRVKKHCMKICRHMSRKVPAQS